MIIRHINIFFPSQIYLLQTCYTHKRIASLCITKDVFNIFVDPKTGWSLCTREIFQLTCPCTLFLENIPLSPWKKFSKPRFLLFFFGNVLHEGGSRPRIQLSTYFPFLPVLLSHFIQCGCQSRAVRVNLLSPHPESPVIHSAQLIS